MAVEEEDEAEAEPTRGGKGRMAVEEEEAVDEEDEAEEGPRGPPGPPACIADELNRLFPEGPPVRPRELVEDCDQLRQLDISQCESDIQQFLVRFFEAGCDERALRRAADE